MERKKNNNKFFVVAIGASAGGLEAIGEILRHISPRTGMAFLYVQHLDPDRKSHLTSILGKATSMPVTEATDGIEIQPDNVYIIPHDKDMSVRDGRLLLNARNKSKILHLPIDQLFTSLAEERQEESIGVLLSGTANDGTLGSKQIRLAGGITIAQDESAKFSGMPKSAISEGVVDLILSPADIARELERLGKQTNLVRKVLTSDDLDADNKDIHLVSIIQLVRKVTGVDFTHYKANTVRRRIIRRMLLHNLKTLQDYARHLRQHTEEVNILYRDLLINVTSFFRDNDSYVYLAKTLFPKIVKHKQGNDPVRIWVPACSSGEEAYSLAMIMVEALGKKITSIPLQIFATDLSEGVIGKARRAIYSRTDVVNVSADRLQRFFTKADGEYKIVKQIRDICIFAPQNVFRDPPFSKMDFISCCNLMIYLEPVLQKKLLSTFHYALNNNGYLMLGKSETIGNSIQLFTPVEKKYKIYLKRKDVVNKAMFDFNYNTPLAVMNETPKPSKITATTMVLSPTDLEKSVNEILLKKYIPATVVVNADLEILHFKGSTSLFLEPAPGKASLNLLKMARPGIEIELRNAIYKASKLGETVTRNGLEIQVKDVTHYVSIEVSLLGNENEEKLFLIVFEELHSVGNTAPDPAITKDKVVEQLQGELKGLREDMRSILGEQEAGHQELQSANEEILSNNEELQSINEELETSKEEVESANEELMTINTELQTRNEQLSESYEHSEAIISIIHEAVVVLDHNLQIKTANRAFHRFFQTSTDKIGGKSIFDISHGQWQIPQLNDLLNKSVNNAEEVPGIEIEHEFKSIGKKALLLNTRKLFLKSLDREIILLIIEDITEQKSAEKMITDREAWFRNMADNAPVMIWVTDKNNKTTFFNKTWLDYTGSDKESAGLIQDIHPEDLKLFLSICRTNLKTQTPFIHKCRLRRNDGEFRWVLTAGRPTYTEDHIFTGFVGTCTEIHDQTIINIELEHRVEQRTSELKIINHDLARSNHDLQQFAYVASHDLQEPLRKIIFFSEKLQAIEDSKSDSAKNYIGKISTASLRMSDLIDDLLNFSRINTANEKFVKTDLKKIVNNTISDLDYIIQEKKAKLAIGSLPIIEAIPVQMTQLFQNIVGNALKFSAPGQAPKIKISAVKAVKKDLPKSMRDIKADVMAISIIDNGIGFSQKYANQIFDIFQRLHDREKFPGTGIGLALCRKITDNHGGQILAKSAKNQGATFTIFLPVSQGKN